jgi:hypothetical protein
MSKPRITELEGDGGVLTQLTSGTPLDTTNRPRPSTGRTKNDELFRLSPTASVFGLLVLAKKAIVSGERDLRRAAEYIAAAQRSGASQRLIAASVGKSAAWVNRLLQWQKSGYLDDTAFGAQSKAGRARTRVQSTKQAELEKECRGRRAGGAGAETGASRATLSAGRCTQEVLLSEGAIEHVLISPTSTQDYSSKQDLLIPELLDRRDVEKEFVRLNDRWIEFRRCLENAPAAARKRFFQEVLEREMPLLKAATDANRFAIANLQGGPT